METTRKEELYTLTLVEYSECKGDSGKQWLKDLRKKIAEQRLGRYRKWQRLLRARNYMKLSSIACWKNTAQRRISVVICFLTFLDLLWFKHRKTQCTSSICNCILLNIPLLFILKFLVNYLFCKYLDFKSLTNIYFHKRRKYSN